MEIQKILPASNFIPFTGYKLKKATVVYLNLPLLHSYGYFSDFTEMSSALYASALEEFAYINPSETDLAEDYDRTQSREFLAERYGGAGILANGGGARCGLHGPFQIKGIGVTPAAGVGVHFWYRHGGLSLKEAIVDAMMGEAAHHALPYGGSRVVAIIDTGTMVWQRAYINTDPELDERIQMRRGLLVRESGIRPAHFSRAVYFKPNEDVRNNHPHDYQRVAENISILPSLMNIKVESNWPDAVPYRLAIDRMMARSATQLAVSKMKRLMHGSLTQSNFFITGGWVDLGTAEAIQHYGDVVIAAAQPSAWQEYTIFQKTCDDLCFYARKFISDENDILDGAAAYKHFLDVYQQTLVRAALTVTGIPAFLLNSLAVTQSVELLGKALVNVAVSEQPQPAETYTSYPIFDWEPNRLRSVVKELYTAYWLQDCKQQPQLPFSSPTNQNLWVTYQEICNAIETLAKEHGIGRRELAIHIGFDMTRRSLTIKTLYRYHITNVIQELIKQESSELPQELHKRFAENDCLIQLYLKDTEGQMGLIYKGLAGSIYWDAYQSSLIFELNPDHKYSYAIEYKPQEFSLLDPLMKRLAFKVRPDNSWAATYSCQSLDDFDDFHDCTLEIGSGSNKSIPLAELFPDWLRLKNNYRAAISGAPIPSDVF